MPNPGPNPQMRFSSLKPWPTGDGHPLHRDLRRAFKIDRALDRRGETPAPITLRKFSWQKDPTQ